MSEHLERYESHWKKHVENDDGEIEKEKVARELYDFDTIREEYVYLLQETTTLSKPFTDARKAMKLHDDIFIRKGIACDDLIEIIDGYVVDEQEKSELIADIKDYFGED